MMYDIFEEVKLYGRLLQKFEIKIREKSWKHGVYTGCRPPPRLVHGEASISQR